MNGKLIRRSIQTDPLPAPERRLLFSPPSVATGTAGHHSGSRAQRNSEPTFEALTYNKWLRQRLCHGSENTMDSSNFKKGRDAHLKSLSSG
jgi:hypothetical protein